MKLIYQGFDGFDVSFQGMIPEYIRWQLEQAKEEAQKSRKDALVFLGENNVPVLVGETGAKGGYRYRFDTGEDGETWFVADSDKADKWNIRVSVKSLALAVHGYHGVKKNIYDLLEALEARGREENFALLERVSRFDYCFDFASKGFSINPRCITAHSRATRRFIGAEELITRSKNIEYARVGQMPNRQIVFYDKKKEIIKRRKDYWWGLWGLDKETFEGNIHRVEIRAGKEELNKWNLKRFSDFEEKACDVLFDIANSIRYVKPNYKEKNSARWKNKEFWDDLLNALQKDLFEFSSGAKRNEIIFALRNKKREEYQSLILSLIPPFMVAQKINLNDFPDFLIHLMELIKKEYRSSPDIFEERYKKAEEKFYFLD